MNILTERRLQREQEWEDQKNPELIEATRLNREKSTVDKRNTTAAQRREDEAYQDFERYML